MHYFLKIQQHAVTCKTEQSCFQKQNIVISFQSLRFAPRHASTMRDARGWMLLQGHHEATCCGRIRPLPTTASSVRGGLRWLE